MQEQKNIRHVGNGHLTLPHTHGLHDHHIKSSVLTDQHAFTGFFTHPAQIAAAGTGSNEGVFTDRETLHPCLVPQDGAP